MINHDEMVELVSVRENTLFHRDGQKLEFKEQFNLSALRTILEIFPHFQIIEATKPTSNECFKLIKKIGNKNHLKKLIFFVFSLHISTISFAQEAEEIVVTGARSGEYSEMPSVTFKKKADFLVQDVQLVNDSRSPELRRSEIIQTIKNIMGSSKKIKGIELSYGNGFLVPINLDDDALKIIDDKKSSDTSRINISIKIAVSQKEPAKVKIEELKKFLKSTNLVGRTLLEEEGDIGLSIINPEQYRYEVLSLIAKENNKLKGVFGADCSAETDGISGRVEWDRVAVDELVLFIRFKTKVVCK